MASGFRRDAVSGLLAACHRRCCICHRFCGVKIETDHIVPLSAGGTDDIDNAIPVCFECHAEIHSYNTDHPRGRKFQPDELRLHKEQWLRICSETPAALVQPSWSGDVGPIQALIDELEFNSRVVREIDADRLGCPLRDEQFSRALREGAIAILSQELKEAVVEAYRAVSAAKEAIASMWRNPPGDRDYLRAANHAQKRLRIAAPLVDGALSVLLEFLGSPQEELCD